MIPSKAAQTAATTVVCNICNKHYSRKDVLQRHHKLKHGPNAAPKPPRKTRRKSCIRCTVLRIKCSLEPVCLHCRKRGSLCQYNFPHPDEAQRDFDSSAKIVQHSPPSQTDTSGQSQPVGTDRADEQPLSASPLSLSNDHRPIGEAGPHAKNLPTVGTVNACANSDADADPLPPSVDHLAADSNILDLGIISDVCHTTGFDPGLQILDSAFDFNLHQPGSCLSDVRPAADATFTDPRVPHDSRPFSCSPSPTRGRHQSSVSPDVPGVDVDGFGRPQSPPPTTDALSNQSLGDAHATRYESSGDISGWESSQPPVTKIFNIVGAPLEGDLAPTTDELMAYWKVYFQRFHKILPVLHEPTIHPENCSPLLLTAITAIGASYFSTMRSQRYYVEAVGALCDVVSAKENSQPYLRYEKEETVLLALCLTFYHILQSRNQGFLAEVLCAQDRVTQMARSMNLYFPGSGEEGLDEESLADTEQSRPHPRIDLYRVFLSTHGAVLERRWHVWVRRESRKRLAWAVAVFRLGCMSLTENDPGVCDEVMHLRIPCPDRMWQARDADAWSSTFPFMAAPPRDPLFDVYLRQCLTHDNVAKESCSFNGLLAPLSRQLMLRRLDGDFRFMFNRNCKRRLSDFG